MFLWQILETNALPPISLTSFKVFRQITFVSFHFQYVDCLIYHYSIYMFQPPTARSTPNRTKLWIYRKSWRNIAICVLSHTACVISRSLYLTNKPMLLVHTITETKIHRVQSPNKHKHTLGNALVGICSASLWSPRLVVSNFPAPTPLRPIRMANTEIWVRHSTLHTHRTLLKYIDSKYMQIGDRNATRAIFHYTCASHYYIF